MVKEMLEREREERMVTKSLGKRVRKNKEERTVGKGRCKVVV